MARSFTSTDQLNASIDMMARCATRRALEAAEGACSNFGFSDAEALGIEGLGCWDEVECLIGQEIARWLKQRAKYSIAERDAAPDDPIPF